MFKLPFVILLVHFGVLCAGSYIISSEEDTRTNEYADASNDIDLPVEETAMFRAVFAYQEEDVASTRIPEVNESSKITPVFRSDYTYHEGADGWFKLHRVPIDWHTARLQCYAEGAVLASPLNTQILSALKGIVKESKVITEQLIGIHLGVHATFSDGVFTSVEGVPLEKLAIEWGGNEPNNYEEHQQCMSLFEDGIGDFYCERLLPYICYRPASAADQLNECGTVDSAYTLNQETGSCYKFHNRGESWPRAHRICQAEGGHLTIINSQREANVIKAIYQQYPTSVDTPSLEWPSVLLGGRQWGSPGSWWTVQGQTLEEAGFSRWGPGEPNNIAGIGAGAETCLSMLRSGFLNDFSCKIPQPFICEKTPPVADNAFISLLQKTM